MQANRFVVTFFAIYTLLAFKTMASIKDTVVLFGTLETGFSRMINNSDKEKSYAPGFVRRIGLGFGIKRSKSTLGVSLFFAANSNRLKFREYVNKQFVSARETIFTIEPAIHLERKLKQESPWSIGGRLGFPVLVGGKFKLRDTAFEGFPDTYKLNVESYHRVNPNLFLKLGRTWNEKNREHQLFAFTSVGLIPIYLKDNKMKWVFVGIGYQCLLKEKSK